MSDNCCVGFDKAFGEFGKNLPICGTPATVAMETAKMLGKSPKVLEIRAKRLSSSDKSQATPVDFSGVPATIGESVRHARDIEGTQTMDLDEFVSETLRQILSGVAKAQGTDLGGNVNAAFPGVLGSNLSALAGFGVFARVDFDVAVTAESTKGGKGSIKVWSIGIEGAGENKSQTVSRVVFAVPLRLPDGDQSKQIEADAADEARMREIRDMSNQDRGVYL